MSSTTSSYNGSSKTSDKSLLVPSIERSGKFSFNMKTPRLMSDSSMSGSTGYITKNTPYPNRRSTDTLPRTSARQRTPYTCGSSSTVPGSRRTPRPPQTPLIPQSRSIAAIVEGRGLAKGEIGLSCIDLNSSELLLSQFSDGPTYVKILTKLQILQPVEIIMPNTALENGKMSSLFEIINEQLSHSPITTVERKYFNESKGSQYVKQLCVPEFDTVELDVQSKYYCLATASALLKYVEFIQNITFAPNSLKVVYRGSEQTMMIDSVAARNLELIVNASNPKSKQSLFGLLNYTKTAGGARLLRSNILQPPCDLSTIMDRFDSVEELTEKEELFLNLKSVISKFNDVDQLISTIVQIPKKDGLKVFEKRIADVLHLKHTIGLIATLKQSLEPSESRLLKAYFHSLDDDRFDLIHQSIQTVIQEESQLQKGTLNMRTQKVFAVKPKINGLLDVARRTHCEVVDDIAEIIRQEAEKTGLALTPNYNKTRGFHIQLNTNGDASIINSLPVTFIKVIKTKNVISCTHEDLIKLNARLEESLEEIYLLSNIVIGELIKNTSKHIGCLYKLSECVSMIDMLVSFAHACTLSNYSRPEFTDILAIKQGRHPLLDKMVSSGPPIANDTYASTTSNFVIITGPNMSGKSTYLRQIALLQVMAQCGSFIPAEYASFRLINQIFVRIGSDDDIEKNCSTFKLEMKEMNYIIRNIGESSLLIIDELGRGTGIEEGVGISYALSEYLIKTKAITFFATHFLQLCDLEFIYSSVENYHLQVQRNYNKEKNKEKLMFSHVLAKGRTQEEHYGIKLAEMSTLPLCITCNARDISTNIAQKRKAKKHFNKSKEEKAVFKLATRLIQTATNSRLERQMLILYLSSLKIQYEKDLTDSQSPLQNED